MDSEIKQMRQQKITTVMLEPIREVWIHDEAFAARRLSIMRIMARRTKAATVVA
jgi:hypothetical protein